MVRRALGVLALLGLLSSSSRALAETATSDQVATNGGDATGPRKKPLVWHDSTLVWEQRATTQTLGLGANYQSSDPYYDWVFYLRPRYYFWEDDRSSVSLRAQFSITREFTNSDLTTEKNQLVFQDTALALAPQHAFYVNGEYLTDLTLNLPRLVLPTSQASFDAGNIVQVGVRAYFLQDFPVRKNEALLPRAHVGLRLGYSYQFARYVVPELSSLHQARMDLDGHSVSNNQLAGAALPEHLGIIHGSLGADIWRNIVGISSEFGVDPALKFALPENVDVCGVVLTGCVPPQNPPDPQRFGVITLFDLSLEFRAFQNSLITSLGYENVTNQLGLDGQRRNFFWSPDAKLYLSVEFQPDLLFEPPVPTAPRAGPDSRRNVASLR
jgi:hypothetical protein